MSEATPSMKAFRKSPKSFPPQIVAAVEKLIKIFEGADGSKEHVAACSVVYEGMKKIKTDPPSATLRAIQQEAKEAVKANPYKAFDDDKGPIQLPKNMVLFKVNKGKYKPEYYAGLHKLIQAYEKSPPSNRKSTLQALKVQIDKDDAGSNTVKEMKKEVEALLKTVK